MKRRRGLSLLETIVASTLLVGVMFLLLDLYPVTAMAVRQSQDQLCADEIAVSIEDQLRSGNFSALQNGTTRYPVVTLDSHTYTPTVTVFDVGSDPTTLKGVNVTVDYQGVRGPRTAAHQIYIVNLQH